MDMATTRIIFAFGALWGNPSHHGDIPVACTRASPEEFLEIAELVLSVDDTEILSSESESLFRYFIDCQVYTPGY
jgi:hypothetical protein